ncbi:MAG: glutamine--fructose-6-phosphate transaminase (isomerizing) [Clostridiales bacterium]|jgi:glucosamine--fructose-6-phosphate aminotransferase (isomerizing)|nr:glutamine--fructose-6-phosphate transaminase (isomerizing) [Clostridiales bacterium]
MCGIIGYTGREQCLPVLIGGLKTLEYRGYDSAGIAVARDGKILVVKQKGRVAELEKILAPHRAKAFCGIGHTRWATHGEPSDVNSHPHSSASGAITVVHNGIIENYLALKRELTDGGALFRSETDTEVIVHLIDRYYSGDLHAAVKKAVARLRGTYAAAVLCVDYPETIVLACKDSPLIVGSGFGGSCLASDIPALLRYTDTLYRMSDGETAVLTPDKISVFGSDGAPVLKKPLGVEWRYEETRLCGAESFMLKEIREIPAALSRTRDFYQNGGFFDKAEVRAILTGIGKIFIIGCGTAYHAALLGRAVIEKLARIPTETDIASEFRYRDPIIPPDSLCLFVSQSGETADTLAAAKLASGRGVRTACITNVAGSALTAVCGLTLPTLAGPEIAVASTKAYNSQLMTLYYLALTLAHMYGRVSAGELSRLREQLGGVCAAADRAYTEMPALAARYKDENNIYFLGRGLDRFTAMEGSLKLKEISYIHSEAYASGELKHGTLALIEEGTPVIALLTQRDLLEKSLNALEEVKARRARVIGIGREKYLKSSVFDARIIIPNAPDLFAPLLSVIPTQLFAYYAARARGCDTDKPRNLAKSVTVE